MELSIEVPQKTKNRITICPTIPLLGIYLDKTFIQKDTCILIPSIHCSTTHNSREWEQPKCPWTGGWIKKMWYINPMEYYAATRKNEIVPFAETWMQLEILIFSEVSKKGKDKHHMISLICGI